MTFHVPPHSYPSHIPLKRGDIVTFTFDFYSGKAVPVNPVITRKRSDMMWDDVIREHLKQGGAQPQTLNGKFFPFFSPPSFLFLNVFYSFFLFFIILNSVLIYTSGINN
jgi:hypothetical protein